MAVQSISCALPCCNSPQEERTKSTLATRITLVGLGVITLITGILILSGIPGFQSLGTTAGWTISGVGALMLLPSVCLRCVHSDKFETLEETSTSPRVVDPRTISRISHGASYLTTDGSIITEQSSYSSLNAFLKSTHADNSAIVVQLKKDVGTEDLPRRLRENFSSNQVEIALPLITKNGVRDNALILKVLTLIFATQETLLALPLEQIKHYHEEEKNILCLRLMRMKDIQIKTEVSTTLEALLDSSVDLFQAEVREGLSPFFNEAQALSIVQNAPILNQKIVEELFPISENTPFITAHTAQLLKGLPTAEINRIVPHARGELVAHLIRLRGHVLNYTLVTEEQVDSFLPTSMLKISDTERKMAQLPIEVLNHLLPLMTTHLRHIPQKHLENIQLDLSALSDKKVLSMFPPSMISESETKKRLGQLHLGALNQILAKMSDVQLRLIPGKHVRNELLALSQLTDKQIKGMFPLGTLYASSSITRINELSSTNQARVKQVLGIPN